MTFQSCRAIRVGFAVACCFMSVACCNVRDTRARFEEVNQTEPEQDLVETTPLVRCPPDGITARWRIDSKRKVELTIELPNEQRVLYDRKPFGPDELSGSTSEHPDSIEPPFTMPTTLAVRYSVSEAPEQGECVSKEPDATDTDDVRTLLADEVFDRPAARQDGSPVPTWQAVLPVPTWSQHLHASHVSVDVPGLSAEQGSSLQLQIDKTLDVSVVLSEANGFATTLVEPVPANGVWTISAIAGAGPLQRLDSLTFKVTLFCKER